MKVLIVGSGGREHAIAASAAKSSKVEKMYCAPGNAGIEEFAECVPIGAMEFEKLVAFAKEKSIDLCIVGMDDPLVGGLVDEMEAAGIRTFGPRKNAAILEGSKAFSKDLMKKYHIPTAAYENFTDPDAAIAYLETAKFPIVLKADGLALGKGVLICQNFEEAKEGVRTIMLDKKFGTAGNEMVIEEFMTGREVSVLSFVDGKTIKTMTSAQDHKRAGDGDTGLNTGGMGTFSPSPFYTKEVEEFCSEHIYQATVDAMAAEGREFKGVIFFGLMLTEEGPKVLEYNARFGDPEAQVVLPRMKNDLIEVVEACIDGTLDQVDLQFEDNAAVCVVLASEGYPVSYEKGFPIQGLEEFNKHEGYGDTGLNTGGMGTFSPSPFYTKEVEEFCSEHIYQATVDAMAAEGREFKGVIFFGLMLTEEGPKVLEYNARFGDPEAQVVLPRMKNDLIEVVEACIDGTLDQVDLQFEDNAAVCVVLASEGYPVSYEKGFPIQGLEEFNKHEGYYCFHAGTKLQDGQIVTNGGRVLGVTAKGKDLKEARANAYAATEWVQFENKYMRHDIGKAIDEV